MTDPAQDGDALTEKLLWLADAPLFIDREQVERFYDAVVRPDAKNGQVTLQVTEEKASSISTKVAGDASLKLSAKGKISPGALLQFLSEILPFLKTEVELGAEAQAKAGGEAGHQRSKKMVEGGSVTLFPIETPERQLEHLALHYLINHTERICFVSDTRDAEWRSPEVVSRVPRMLVFIDLPGQEQALAAGLPETRLIPTAAEFGNGEVVPLFMELTADNGARPPAYPEIKADEYRRVGIEDRQAMVRGLAGQRKEYWAWFEANFNAKRAIEVVEKASALRGGLRWIDFRVPLTPEGDTLHLHIAPSQSYPTGTFAYNFIKRGHKHGLRLVGTLKSEPDMNVLAIYEK